MLCGALPLFVVASTNLEARLCLGILTVSPRRTKGVGGAKPPVSPEAQPKQGVAISKNNPLDRSSHEAQSHTLNNLTTHTFKGKKNKNNNLGSVPSALRAPERSRSAPGVDRHDNQFPTLVPSPSLAPASKSKLPNIRYI